MQRKSPAPDTAPDIDLWSSESFASGHPVEQYRWLHRNAPVHWHHEPDGPGFWAVTSHALVKHVSLRPEIFSSHAGGITIHDPPREELELLRTMMLNMDRPQHSRYRKLVSNEFTPRKADSWGATIDRTARTILDEVCERGECDLVADVAGKLPSYVIAGLLGVPIADGIRLYDLTEIMHSAPDAVSEEQRSTAVREMLSYAGHVREHKLAEPGEDLATRLVQAEVDGDYLTAEQFASFFLLLVNAGGDTTRNLVGATMVTLLERPELMRRLQRNLDDLMPTAVDEMLRFQSPVIQMRRTAVCDTDLDGTRIAEGDKVVMYYGAANRDSAVFENPDEPVLDRSPNDHVAFGGGGAHFCLGSHFGRIEASSMIGQLLTRLPDLELAGTPTWLASNFICGPTHVPVRFTPVDAA